MVIDNYATSKCPADSDVKIAGRKDSTLNCAENHQQLVKEKEPQKTNCKLSDCWRAQDQSQCWSMHSRAAHAGTPNVDNKPWSQRPHHDSQVRWVFGFWWKKIQWVSGSLVILSGGEISPIFYIFLPWSRGVWLRALFDLTPNDSTWVLRVKRPPPPHQTICPCFLSQKRKKKLQVRFVSVKAERRLPSITWQSRDHVTLTRGYFLHVFVFSLCVLHFVFTILNKSIMTPMFSFSVWCSYFY